MTASGREAVCIPVADNAVRNSSSSMLCGERSTAVTASDARGMANAIFGAVMAASDARGVADTIFGAVVAASNATGLADAIFGAVSPCGSSPDSVVFRLGRRDIPGTAGGIGLLDGVRNMMKEVIEMGIPTRE
jgi:hypothetical protein